MNEPSERVDQIAHATIGAAIAVHRALGPGFSEKIYENALCVELAARGLAFERQVALAMLHRGERIGDYVMDVVVAGLVVVELKAIEELAPIHSAQLNSYLRASGLRIGLLLNFNVPILRDGIRRIIRSERVPEHTP